MRIKFPFVIRQIDDLSIEVELITHGAPLVEINPHEVFHETITDTLMDEIYRAVVEKLVRASLVVTGD